MEPMAFICNGQTLTAENREGAAYIKNRDGKRVELVEQCHSVAQHRFLFRLVSYLYRTYGEAFKSFETFRYYVSVSVGHCDLVLRLKPDGQWDKVLEARSWSMPKTNQQAFNALTNLVSQFALEKYGFDMAKYMAMEPDANEDHTIKYKLRMK